MNDTSLDDLRAQFIAWEIASRDTIEVKRCYIDAAGDLISGILLSQIVYWHLPNVKGEDKLRVSHDDGQWLAKKRDDWWQECRITPKQFDRAVKILKSKGLIEVKLAKYAGNPTKHVRINWNNLIANIEQVLPTSDNRPKATKTVDIPQRSKTDSSSETLNSSGYSPKVKFDIAQKGKSYT